MFILNLFAKPPPTDNELLLAAAKRVTTALADNITLRTHKNLTIEIDVQEIIPRSSQWQTQVAPMGGSYSYQYAPTIKYSPATEEPSTTPYHVLDILPIALFLQRAFRVINTQDPSIASKEPAVYFTSKQDITIYLNLLSEMVEDHTLNVDEMLNDKLKSLHKDIMYNRGRVLISSVMIAEVIEEVKGQQRTELKEVPGLPEVRLTNFNETINPFIEQIKTSDENRNLFSRFLHRIWMIITRNSNNKGKYSSTSARMLHEFQDEWNARRPVIEKLLPQNHHATPPARPLSRFYAQPAPGPEAIKTAEANAKTTRQKV